MRHWNIKYEISALLDLRDQLGPAYGSEDLCVLLYSIVKRHQPAVIVELGTGLGVSSAWMAAAIRENGVGHLYTVDNGSHFQGDRCGEYFCQLSGSLHEITGANESLSYTRYLEWIFGRIDVSECITFLDQDISLDPQSLRGIVGGKPIDMMFSDFNHSPETIFELFAACLPCLAPTSNVFIDSASTYMPSSWVIDDIVNILNTRRIPAVVRKFLDDEALDAAKILVEHCTFDRVDLIERNHRDQNSTTWIKVSPADVLPALASTYRL